MSSLKNKSEEQERKRLHQRLRPSFASCSVAFQSCNPLGVYRSQSDLGTEQRCWRSAGLEAGEDF